MSATGTFDDYKEFMDPFRTLKEKFDSYSRNWKSNNAKINVKSLFQKNYNLLRNQLMNYFCELVQKNPVNITKILRVNLDFECWNLLVERICIVLKYPIDAKHFGKNSQVIIQNIYSDLLEDLRTLYAFYREIYLSVYNLQITPDQEKDFNKDSPIFISNVLNHMGDIKKLKLYLNKKFFVFDDLINLEGDSKKDANDAIKFFNYSLNNNPYNYIVFNNLAYVYKEFLDDHLNSIYWYIRSLSSVNQDKDNKKNIEFLEKELEEVRKIQSKKQYNIYEDVNNITFLKYDLEHFPLLFYRIIGILFRKIDIDKLETYNSNFKILLTRILINYSLINDNFKVNFETYGDWSKMLLLSIFSFHYSLDSEYTEEKKDNNNSILSSYTNEPEKIILNENNLLNYSLYSHNLTKKMTKSIKPNLKESLNLITQFTKCVIMNMNEANYNLVEKYLLIYFYWLSLNYDIYNLLIDDEEKTYLKFLNYYLRNHNDISKFLMPQTRLTLNLLVEKINNYILPIESSFIGFLPINRFFELNQKPKGQYIIQDNKEIQIMNKLILIHFLDLFGLHQQNDINVSKNFFNYNKGICPINIKNVTDTNDIQQNISKIKEQLNANNNLISINKEKKEKPEIVLDASNIAMRHGEQKGIYSTKGIQIAIDFFTKNGHKVISFLPDYLFKEKDPNPKYVKKRVLPDNLAYLYGLVNKGLVVKSPPQDYDDSYCIQYAKMHDAFIVTNDLFRDYIEGIKDKTKKETERKWRDVKCISFTFNGDEFLPNPDAPFFKDFNFNLQEYCNNVKKGNK